MSRPFRSSSTLLAGLTLFGLFAAACGDRSGKLLDDPVFPPPATTVAATTLPPQTDPPVPLTLTAPWVDGASVPARYTCADTGASPALTWHGVPPGTVELAVSVADLDAGGYVHWLVYAIPPTDGGLTEGQPPTDAFEWRNSTGVAGWEPLCPPSDESHRIEFTVHALNQQLEVADDAAATEVLAILNATTIARSSVVGFATGDP